MTRIDLHAHVIPDAYRELLVARDGSSPFVPPARMEELMATMERYEIDAAAISTGPPGAYLGDEGQASELARAANESIAAIVRSAPDRFGGLALLPLPDVEAAIAELRYALDELELDGVMLLSNTAGVYLGDDRWEAVYEELDRREAYVLVHPAPPPHVPPLGDEHPVWLYEFPFDTTRALAKLIFSGTLERHSSIRFQLAHLGGVAPFLAQRLASLAERAPEQAQRAPAGALEYLRRQYYDTGLSASAPAIAATLEITSLGQIVFGTDWPYAALPNGVDPAPALAALGAEGRAAIDCRNAAALVPRLAPTPV
jgi:predicted TIM-barrel fold metal-dependent hydrolase